MRWVILLSVKFVEGPGLSDASDLVYGAWVYKRSVD